MQAAVISIGDELALGQSLDTNSAWISARLSELGVLTRFHETVPDDRREIARAIRGALELAEIIVVTGGLGPTQDDLTRQAVAEALNSKLILNQDAMSMIERFFRDRGRSMSDSNRLQALIPEGAAAIFNETGTAPGFRISAGKSRVFVLPGVPLEMKPMFESGVVPELGRGIGRRILTCKINTFGMGESAVGEVLGDLMDRARNPLIGTTVSSGVVSVRIRSDFQDYRRAREELVLSVAAVERRLGRAVFGMGDETLAGVIGGLLRSRRRTLAVAESCTAGMLSAMLTESPGSSKWFLGGWTVYSNRMKNAMLGVPSELIARSGAVSGDAARFMAREAVLRSGSDYSLALTGIAGPSGGSPGKPVGTVWLGMGKTDAAGGVSVTARDVLLAGGRETVRKRAAFEALNMLRLELLDGSPSARE